MKKNKAFDISDYKTCENCIYSGELPDSDIVICRKHGLKNSGDSCRHFKMDLLSVKPKKLRSLKSTLSEEDFKL